MYMEKHSICGWRRDFLGLNCNTCPIFFPNSRILSLGPLMNILGISLWEPSFLKFSFWKSAPVCNVHVYFWKFLYFMLYKTNNTTYILLHAFLIFAVKYFVLYISQFTYLVYYWLYLDFFQLFFLLITNDTEHLFICLYAVCASSVRCLW